MRISKHTKREWASILGIVFESGFKVKVSEILEIPLKKGKIVVPENLPEEWEKIYRGLGGLIAEIFVSPIRDKKILEISEMVEFNEGKYPLGDYRNADFYTVWEENSQKNALFVELTKERDLLVLSENEIYKPSDISLSITENLTYREYFEEIYSTAERLFNSLPLQATGELKKLLQLLTYASDFMLKRFVPDNLELLILYPTKDAFKLYFPKERLNPPPEELLINAKKLLKTLKLRKEDVANLTFKERVLKFYPKKEISKVRKEVEEFLFKHSKRGNSVVLLHSPATGKTTSTLSLVSSLAKQKPVLFVYFSSRIAIVESVAERLEQLGFKVFKNKGYNIRKHRKDYAKYSFLEKEGNLKNIRKEFLTSSIPPKSAITSTFHSVVRTKVSNTLTHLLTMIKVFTKKYPDCEVVIAIDEILGLENGFSAYRDLLSALKKENLLNKTRIVVFDASIYSGKNFENEYLLKAGHDKNIPPHLTPSEYQPFYRTVLEDTEHICGFEAGFPAKSLKVKHRIFELPPVPSITDKEEESGRKEKLKEIARYIGLKGFERGVGIFAQNTEFLSELSNTIISLYPQVREIVLINSVKKPKIEDVENKLFLFTSALSRGIDLPVENFFIFVPTFNVETNLAEILQVFYRIRDGKTDGFKEKEVNVIHLVEINDKEENIYQLLTQKALANLIDQLLEAYINPDGKKTYKIPFPALKENIFEPNLISFVDRLRMLKLYINTNSIEIKTKWKRKELFEIFVLGWATKKPPKIIYPFAVFENINLKIKIVRNIEDEVWEILKGLIREDQNLPYATKNQILEFIEQFKGSSLSIITKAPLCIFLPNLVIPTRRIKKALFRINSIGRIGIHLYPWKVRVVNSLVRQFFNPLHDEDLIGFFPAETLGNYLSLPQIPLIYFAT